MSKLIEKLRQYLRQMVDEPEHSMSEQNRVFPTSKLGMAASEETKLIDEAAVIDLMHRIERTQENAYSCEEAYALLDEYVELAATNEQAARLMPLVKNHIDLCPGCREEFEILLEILKSEFSP